MKIFADVSLRFLVKSKFYHLCHRSYNNQAQMYFAILNTIYENTKVNGKVVALVFNIKSQFVSCTH